LVAAALMRFNAAFMVCRWSLNWLDLSTGLERLKQKK